SLVTAGPLLLSTANAHGATVLPVDSEHSAVFQALIGEEIDAVERIIITASGGAFRDHPLDALESVTVEEASSHPNWDMGQRITIDSASMFNKAMELIETKEFFGVRADQIETIVHPESLIHALVGFNDGALMAHVGPPDMRHAIGFALHWPDRKTLPVERLDLAQIGQFTFREPCNTRYPALAIARRVMEEGGLTGAVFNAAKEAALDGFIAHDCGFTDMARIVAEVVDVMLSREGLKSATITLDSVRDADAAARQLTAERIAAL
ncbi:MAG: 1-deoxy-D-xylulose-5-phosphate reductoisomerase, partial [Pseudomonadota bacterium]